jgi:F0F1-type ATP synthase epsilon subunit
MKTFYVTVAKVGETLFEGEAKSITLRGVEGVFTVLAGHEAFVCELVPGVAQIEDADGKKHSVDIPSKGIAEVSGTQATVLL